MLAARSRSRIINTANPTRRSRRPRLAAARELRKDSTMPELPDVELFRRRLVDHGLGRRIVSVAVNDRRVLGGLSAARFAARLRGARLVSARRHGKHLLVELDKSGWLTLHFGMTGSLELGATKDEPPAFTRVRLDLADGHRLAYVNKRMLGHVGLTDDADDFIAAEGLGPDALDPRFDRAAFRAAIAGRKQDVKAALMDQSAMAGVGNIYADEILFQARLNPRLRADRLDERAMSTLFRKTKATLAKAIARGAGSERQAERLGRGSLLSRRAEGARCPRCGATIAMIRINGRSTFLCARCQPAPR